MGLVRILILVLILILIFELISILIRVLIFVLILIVVLVFVLVLVLVLVPILITKYHNFILRQCLLYGLRSREHLPQEVYKAKINLPTILRIGQCCATVTLAEHNGSRSSCPDEGP